MPAAGAGAGMTLLENGKIGCGSTRAGNGLFKDFTITKRLKTPSSAFTFKTLLKHNAKWALTKIE